MKCKTFGKMNIIGHSSYSVERSKGKGKVFPYSLPSVGPGADPGVQAVSPQVT